MKEPGVELAPVKHTMMLDPAAVPTMAVRVDRDSPGKTEQFALVERPGEDSVATQLTLAHPVSRATRCVTALAVILRTLENRTRIYESAHVGSFADPSLSA